MTVVNVVIPLSMVEIGGATILDFKSKVRELIPRALRTAAYQAERRIKGIVPVSQRPWERASGGLREATHVYHSTSDMTTVFGTDYAEYVDKGTPAHAVIGDMHWQPAPGVWGHSQGHMVRGIRPHNLTEQAQRIMREELEMALVTLIFAELGGVS